VPIRIPQTAGEPNQYVALPWVVGQFDPGQRIVVYDVAPVAIQPLLFARNAWPNFGDPVRAPHPDDLA
jgi:hypothetical protein